MSKVFHDLKIGLDEDLEEKLAWLVPGHSAYHILKKSVDARQRHSPHLVYSVEVFEAGEPVPPTDIVLERLPRKFTGSPPLIVGAGPGGLFAALRLVERGIPCHLFERGSDAGRRMFGINKFWRYGELDPRNNVCFGEGGAGLYSDGKLITRIKSPHIPYVLKRLVEFGAPEEILYLANPHVGSDKIRRVIPKLRQRIIELGGVIHFDTQVTEFLVEGARIVGLRTERGEEYRSDHVILACGHSAEDVFEHLRSLGVFMEGKSFAVGLRVEHPQAAINKIQYREHAENPKLGAANYKLTFHDKPTGVGVYSFCMCPGGYVLSSGTEPDGLVCNGMSNYNRGSPFANSAVVVTVDHNASFGKDVWGGMKFRRALEQRAFQMVRAAGGTKQLPAQRLVDFLEGAGRGSSVNEGMFSGAARMNEGRPKQVLKTSSPSGVVPAPLHELLPPAMREHLVQGFESFNKSMRGFKADEAQLHGVESRTSCPIRITRDEESLQSVSHGGLYPCGEGAGYAGGITSAACDGIRIAEKIFASF